MSLETYFLRLRLVEMVWLSWLLEWGYVFGILQLRDISIGFVLALGLVLGWGYRPAIIQFRDLAWE